MKVCRIENSISDLYRELTNEKLNHASFMKDYCVQIIREENIIRMIGIKLTSDNAIEEYNDVYRAHQEIDISSILVLT